MRAFRLAYDGTDYYGYQRQPDVETVEGVLFDALRALDVFDHDRETPPKYSAAGRTDRGVSALAQTVAIDAPAWLTPRALNGELPAGVRAWAYADVPTDFHATHDAHEREYTYHLHAPDVSRTRLETALASLSGEHDFHNLTPDDDGTVRDIEWTLTADGPFFVLRLRSGGFARQLVRRVVGLASSVASGERPLAAVDRLLSDERVDGGEGVAPAPPEPLVLTDVCYPDVVFTTDPEAATSARTVFDERRVTRLTGARVAGTVLDGLG